MSTTFRVISGDTFESISRKAYGTEAEASRVLRANPGVSEPLTVGTVINTPLIPEAPRNVPQAAPSANENEIAIHIEGKRFRFWDSVRITRSMDAMDKVEFGAPFDSAAPGFRETFRPFSYKPVDITIGGAPLFTGTMVTPLPVVDPKRITLSVSCYSLPGVLNDCMPPASMYSDGKGLLEFLGLGLAEIAKNLAAPFGLGVEFQADQGAVFEQVAIEPTKKILPFLVELAKQRNLIISSNALGSLIFLQEAATGSPVARLEQGRSPVLSITPHFSPQAYYSHVTGVDPVMVGLDGGQFTVKNTNVPGVIRPMSFTVPDTLSADIKAAVEAKAGRMFGNAVSYSIEVDTLRDPAGNPWTRNTSLTLLAPDAMIYSEYEFIIRSVELNRDRASETARLNLVIPGSFNGKVPEALPWDG